jgi:hypothetical protein
MSVIINATTGGNNQDQANELFKACIADVKANAALETLSVGGFSTMSSAQIQASSMTQSSQFTPNVENTQQDTTTTSSESRTTSQHTFRLPNLPFSFNGLGVVSEDPR